MKNFSENSKCPSCSDSRIRLDKRETREDVSVIPDVHRFEYVWVIDLAIPFSYLMEIEYCPFCGHHLTGSDYEWSYLND